MVIVLVVLIFFSVPLSCSMPAASCAHAAAAVPTAKSPATSADSAAFVIQLVMCVVLVVGDTDDPRVAVAASGRRLPHRGLYSSSRRRQSLVGVDVRLRLCFGPELALPLRDDRGRNAVADDVGRRATHIEELIDAHDQQQPRFGDIE